MCDSASRSGTDEWKSDPVLDAVASLFTAD